MGISDQLQRFVRSRIVRLTAAVSLIGLVLWAFAPYIGFRISSTAYVNADLERVSTPIAGKFEDPLMLEKGSYLATATEARFVVAFSQDTRTLLHLGRQIAAAEKRAVLERRQLAEIDAADVVLAARGELFRTGIVAKLSSERDETAAEIVGCAAELKQRSDVRARMDQLVKLGTASEIRSSESLAAQVAVSTRCDIAEARLSRLKAELAAAEKGVFLRDGINDAPYSQQQRDRLILQRREIETKLEDDLHQSGQLAETERQQEKDRVAGLNTFSVVLPAHYVVWAMNATAGSMVTEGQSLFDLANCDKRFVIVEVAERDFESIVAGQFVDVRLIGGGDWRKGRVLQARGSAAQSNDRLLAAQAPRPDREKVTVEITFPNDPLRLHPNSFCNIGRMAEVRFRRSGLGFLADWSRTLTNLIGYTKEDAAIDRGVGN
jgi:multidrug resistance efflux pump